MWLFGWIPITLGVRELIRAIRARGSGERVRAAVATGSSGVMGLTLANGGDNLAAYTPVFRTISAATPR